MRRRVLHGIDVQAAAQVVMEDLNFQAGQQSKSRTRQGQRWAIELARAAATIEQAYGLEDDSE